MPDIVTQTTAPEVSVSARAEALGASSTRDRRFLVSPWVMAPVLAALAGILINAGVQGQGALSHTGYTAGTGDQTVLTPDGLHLADPGLFANDFFLENSPSPHWFFNLVTAFGHQIGHLSTVYFIYWFVGLVMFGFATALLAKRWVPTHPWAASILFTVVMGLSPWAIVGTGSPMIAAAIPAVAGGFAAYLTCAALLTGRFPLAATAGALTALLHVQQGLVVAILLIASALFQTISRRRPAYALIAGAVASGALTGYGLWGSGFGGSISDFVQVCNEMIPYHCAAHLWSPATLIVAGAVIVLAVVGIRLVPMGDRVLWVTSVGLVAIGLALGLISDALRIPVLGDLAQGANIYRLGAVIVFFTMWGLISYAFSPVGGRRDRGLFLVWLVASAAYLIVPGWQFPNEFGWPTPILLLAVLVVSAWGGRLIGRRPGKWGSRATKLPLTGAWVASVLLLAMAFAGGFLRVQPLDVAIQPNAEIRAWGAAVQKVIPEGDIVLSAPNAMYMRLATLRANIADCKDVPYGGRVYAEWKDRLDDLGGWKVQCRSPYPGAPFNALSASDLDRAAHKYGARFIILEEGQMHNLPGLESLGWVVKLRPVNALQNVVLELV